MAQHLSSLALQLLLLPAITAMRAPALVPRSSHYSPGHTLLVQRPVLRYGSPAMLLSSETAVSSKVSGLIVQPSVLVADVVTDTLLDLAVYALLLGVVGLSVFSIYATLQESNRKAGGWTKPEDGDPMDMPSESRLKSGMIYDPVTDQWTKREDTVENNKGLGGPVGQQDNAAGNRYERRVKSKGKSKKRRSK